MSLTLDRPYKDHLPESQLQESQLTAAFNTPFKPDDWQELKSHSGVSRKDEIITRALDGTSYILFPLRLFKSTTTIMHSIATRLHKLYPSTVFSHLSSATPVLRMRKGTLCIFGTEGRGTGFHVDVASAINIALSVAFTTNSKKRCAPSDGPLAYWLFVRPTEAGIEAVSAWLIKHLPSDYPQGFMRNEQSPAPALSVKHIQALHDAYPEHTMLIEQHHGDVVVVPIGWIHCVTNLQLCFKIAFDRVMPGDCAKVALCQQLIISKVFGPCQGTDYVALMPDIMEELDWINTKLA